MRPSRIDQDQVRVPDGAQPVGDDDAGPALEQGREGRLDDRLGARVYVARRLVQDEDARVGQHRPGEGEQLALALAQRAAALAEHRVVAVGQVR